MQKSGDGSGGPTKPPQRPRSRVLGVKTMQGVLPGQLPQPMVEILKRESNVAHKKRSERPPPPKAEGATDLDIIEISGSERYCIEGVLGRGGFGIVYRATHYMDSKFTKGEFVIDDPVAIKVVSINEAELQSDPEGPDKARARLNEKFETEVKLAKKLKDPNIVTIETYGLLSDGRPFYVMELLNGMDLEAILNERQQRGEGPLEWDKLKPVMLQVCSALETAHNYEDKDGKKPIIHRDIKPANMFIETSRIGDWRVKVLDFGMAQLTAASKGDAKDKDKRGGGSPWYMSPEQACEFDENIPAEQRVVDERSDIWSVGATMYELLTGRPPFEFEILDKTDTQTSDEYNEYRAMKWNEIKDRLRRENPKAFPFANPDASIPEEVEEIVFRCLEKNPAKRFQSVKELSDAIAKVKGAMNGNGDEKTMRAINPFFEPPVIINDPELLDQMEAEAARQASAAQPKRSAPPEGGASPQQADAQVPDLSEDHPTMPKYEKTEIVRVRGAAGGSASKQTVLRPGPRKKLSKWLLIGTIAGSVAAAGIGTAVVVGMSRTDDSGAQVAQENPMPGKAPDNPGVVRAPPHVPRAATDAGAEAVGEASSADATAPQAEDTGPGQALETTPEHLITLNTGVPGVQVLLFDSPGCRTGADGSCTLTLPAQEESVRLTFRKRGYVDVHRDVVPDQDRAVRITMERVPTKAPGQNPPTKNPGGYRINSE